MAASRAWRTNTSDIPRGRPCRLHRREAREEAAAGQCEGAGRDPRRRAEGAAGRLGASAPSAAASNSGRSPRGAQGGDAGVNRAMRWRLQDKPGRGRKMEKGGHAGANTRRGRRFPGGRFSLWREYKTLSLGVAINMNFGIRAPVLDRISVLTETEHTQRRTSDFRKSSDYKGRGYLVLFTAKEPRNRR